MCFWAVEILLESLFGPIILPGSNLIMDHLSKHSNPAILSLSIRASVSNQKEVGQLDCPKSNLVS